MTRGRPLLRCLRSANLVTKEAMGVWTWTRSYAPDVTARLTAAGARVILRMSSGLRLHAISTTLSKAAWHSGTSDSLCAIPSTVHPMPRKCRAIGRRNLIIDGTVVTISKRGGLVKDGD